MIKTTYFYLFYFFSCGEYFAINIDLIYVTEKFLNKEDDKQKKKRKKMTSHPDNIPPPKADFTAPPPYDAKDYSTVIPSEPSKLPTYEEVQLEKTLHGEMPMPQQMMPPPICPPGRPPHHVPGAGAVTFIAIDAADAENMAVDNSLLGTGIEQE